MQESVKKYLFLLGFYSGLFLVAFLNYGLHLPGAKNLHLFLMWLLAVLGMAFLILSKQIAKLNTDSYVHNDQRYAIAYTCDLALAFVSAWFGDFWFGVAILIWMVGRIHSRSPLSSPPGQDSSEDTPEN